MTDTCFSFNALVAQATGESVFEISRRGFHDAMPADVRFDPEPAGFQLTDRSGAASDCSDADLVDLGELGIDWDEVLGGSRRDPAGGRRRLAGGGSSPPRRRMPACSSGGAR